MSAVFQKISCWPDEDRPVEKLFSKGEHTLNDSELLAILLSSGSRGQTALDLARKILTRFKSFQHMSHNAPIHWNNFKGLGKIKLARIKAAIEIARRFQEKKIDDKPLIIESSTDVVTLLRPRMQGLKKEVVKVLMLNSESHLLCIEEITQGTVNFCMPIIREIFEKALQNYASGIICVHNHPSHNVRPSPQDIEFTHQLCEAGKVLQINVLDHIILTHDGSFSFMEDDLPKESV